MVQGSLTNVKGAALTRLGCFDVDADDEDKTSFCLHLCARRRVSQTSDCWAMQKRLACSPGESKSGMSSTVFFMSLRDRLSCADFLDFFSRRTMYCRLVKTTSTVLSTTDAHGSKLLTRIRSLLLQLCTLKHAVKARSRAATLVSKDTKELLGRFLVTLCGT